MSIKKAMQTYARQGGTSSIFVHDDGLQLISEADRQQRILFYAENGIGWVARPKHDSSEGGFDRRGRFKKASNMNYGLALSLKMEEYIVKLELERAEKASVSDSAASDKGGEEIEEEALRLAVEEIFEESGQRFRPWAHNAKAIRMGEIILIVDSDTIVPEVRPSHFSPISRLGADDLPQDCFRDAARELAECPEVAIIQHESGESLIVIFSQAPDVLTQRRCYAGRASLLREWNRTLYPACQQVYLDVMRKWGSGAFCGAQRIPSLVCTPGRRVRRPRR